MPSKLVGTTVLTRIKSVERLEYHGQSVVTIRQIAEVHSKTPIDVHNSFARNRDRFQEGDDFYTLVSSECKNIGLRAPSGAKVLTERGCLRLVKTFGDDLAWKIQGQLVGLSSPCHGIPVNLPGFQDDGSTTSRHCLPPS